MRSRPFYIWKLETKAHLQICQDDIWSKFLLLQVVPAKQTQKLTTATWGVAAQIYLVNDSHTNRHIQFIYCFHVMNSKAIKVYHNKNLQMVACGENTLTAVWHAERESRQSATCALQSHNHVLLIPYCLFCFDKVFIISWCMRVCLQKTNCLWGIICNQDKTWWL